MYNVNGQINNYINTLQGYSQVYVIIVIHIYLLRLHRGFKFRNGHFVQIMRSLVAVLLKMTLFMYLLSIYKKLKALILFKFDTLSFTIYILTRPLKVHHWIA